MAFDRGKRGSAKRVGKARKRKQKRDKSHRVNKLNAKREKAIIDINT